uniref:Protein kinase domain-containing protein n=1 Tax=Macrostomum lignano TaxID=282301 RepID=A0A1I8FI51_9PLAT
RLLARPPPAAPRTQLAGRYSIYCLAAGRRLKAKPAPRFAASGVGGRLRSSVLGCTAFTPLLAKLLLGPIGQAISRRANRFSVCRGFSARHLPGIGGSLKLKPKTKLSSRYEVTLHLGRGAYGYVKAAVRRSDGAQLAAHQLMERPESLGGGLVPSLDEPLASYMFRQMASAVAYLHSRALLIRDLKDENVILDERFCLMLIDFGAAAFVSPDRPFSVFCGTMEYCAPEILQGHPYFGPEADVWSLGVTLYTLVFGENPFFDVDETLAGVLKPQWKPSPQLSRLLRVMPPGGSEASALASARSSEPPVTTQPVILTVSNFEDVLPNCASLAGNHQHGVNQRTRTVQLSRSRIGFGFTINGQSPCMLSCIVPGSPADLAALRPGDALLGVNGVSVRGLAHDDVAAAIARRIKRLCRRLHAPPPPPPASHRRRRLHPRVATSDPRIIGPEVRYEQVPRHRHQKQQQQAQHQLRHRRSKAAQAATSARSASRAVSCQASATRTVASAVARLKSEARAVTLATLDIDEELALDAESCGINKNEDYDDDDDNENCF